MSDTALLASRAVREVVRTPEALLPTIFIPLFFLVVNTGQVSEIFTASNYSYRAHQGHGPQHLLIGDAYGFVDPMFSTGVLMAMTAGELGAETAHSWLDDPVRGQRLAERTNR